MDLRLPKTLLQTPPPNTVEIQPHGGMLCNMHKAVDLSPALWGEGVTYPVVEDNIACLSTVKYFILLNGTP